ncbi:DNA polymerase III subunit delta [Desulforamulus putei]|uniref:DNA polymerase III subunit delta n=1 Tax=Desulforamulus putei DSM 12395 TaxID=1121429 RepID=A0A1M5C3I6_9FIRM|nr:DNA polymerase III subunit delta [Desulforamulus putei]SHF48992.1 DNA polymerase III, delta subunit [Desulforamulus putei DSM 12395]
MEYYKGLLNSLARGQISPVYLFYGEEEYLKEKAVEKFKEVLLPQAADFNLDVVDGEETDLAAVVSLAENLPFLAERRLVIVKNTPWFSGKGKAKGDGEQASEDGKTSGKEAILLNYLSNPSPTTCLIFMTGEPVDRRKKLYKAVGSAGQAIEFKALKQAEMVSWVTQKIKAAGKKIDPAAARALVEANGKLGLLNLSNEVEKLLTYLGEGSEITLRDVRQVGVMNVEQNIFTVVDEAVAGHTSHALAGIRELLALKEQPPKILAMLARQIRIAIQVEALVREGCPEREVAGKLGLQDFVVRKALHQARKSGSRKLEWALEQIAVIDADIKKGRQDFLPAIESTLIKFSQL